LGRYDSVFLAFCSKNDQLRLSTPIEKLGAHKNTALELLFSLTKKREEWILVTTNKCKSLAPPPQE
jgi:hypothetical protein